WTGPNRASLPWMLQVTDSSMRQRPIIILLKQCGSAMARPTQFLVTSFVIRSLSVPTAWVSLHQAHDFFRNTWSLAMLRQILLLLDLQRKSALIRAVFY